MKPRKIGIIGIGHVGSHVANMLISNSLCDELVIIDSEIRKAKAQVIDLQDTMAYQESGCRIYLGTYKDLGDADIIIVSVGGKFFDENRLEELSDSMEIIDEIAPKIEASGFSGIVLSITNPCDLIAYYLNEKLSATVIGTGTALDSARFRIRIAMAMNVDVKSVQAFCIGEHGDSQVPVWSQVQIGGNKLDTIIQNGQLSVENFDKKRIEKSTIFAGWEIADAKGSTEFGIGMATAEIVKAIYTDANKVLPCSVMLQGEYGEEGLYTSVPCIIGRKGVVKVWELPLSDTELQAFHQSCQLLKSYMKKKM